MIANYDPNKDPIHKKCQTIASFLAFFTCKPRSLCRAGTVNKLTDVKERTAEGKNCCMLQDNIYPKGYNNERELIETCRIIIALTTLDIIWPYFANGIYDIMLLDT